LTQLEQTLNVLFICTGNICRSPTAERLALVHNSGQPIPAFVSSSAGIHALVGSPSQPNAATAFQLGDDYDKINDPFEQYMNPVQRIAMPITKLHNVLLSKNYWAAALTTLRDCMKRTRK
jgi:hypothetical protein